MSLVAKASPARGRIELFPKPLPLTVTPAGVVDALYAEVNFAFGILSALRGIEAIDASQMDGAMHLVDVHIANLRAIGRLAERVRP
jgi:hypothetical protein